MIWSFLENCDLFITLVVAHPFLEQRHVGWLIGHWFYESGNLSPGSKASDYFSLTVKAKS